MLAKHCGKVSVVPTGKRITCPVQQSEERQISNEKTCQLCNEKKECPLPPTNQKECKQNECHGERKATIRIREPRNRTLPVAHASIDENMDNRKHSYRQCPVRHVLPYES